MLAVIVFAFLSVLGMAIMFGELAQHSWKSYEVEFTPGAAIWTYIIQAGIVWWVVASVGLVWSTWALIGLTAVGAVIAMYKAVADGYRKRTVAGAIGSSVITTVLIIGLFAAL